MTTPSVLFICGASGAGTTLLSSLIDQHLRVDVCIPESALIGPADRQLRMRPVVEYESLDVYERAMHLGPTISSESIHAECSELYSTLAQSSAPTSVIDKAPNVHLVRLALLAEAFPQAKFVVIHRDPPANVEGLGRKWAVFEREPIERLARFWRDMHLTCVTQAERAPGRVVSLAYESLICQQELTISALGRWAGFEPRPCPRAMADRADVPGKGLRNVYRGLIRISPDANRASRARLGPERCREVERIASPARDALASLASLPVC